MIFKRIFEPLGLKSAGLGPQATFGKYDAPVGHRIDDKGRITSRPWGQAADLPAALGPAGLVHMNVEDFATWAAWNAGEGKRGPALIKPETLKRLHEAHVSMEIAHPKPGTPKTGSYGFGWGLAKFDWSDKPLLTHNGSNGMNFSSILVDVDHDAGIVVMTNIAGDKADPASIETTRELYERYVKGAKSGP
jgi:CubicO group peptidase (beta-lactamase class C family)